MRIHRVRIRNIMGLEALDIEPGTVTIVEGANATGKTSVLEAIRSVIRGGHDATLLRHGADSGEVSLILEDGTEITKEVSEHRSKTSARHPEMGRITAPMAYLRGLFDRLFNPVAFLTAKASDQVEMLLEAVPLPVTADLAAKVQEITGRPDAFMDCLAGFQDFNALEAIAGLRATLYSQRTERNTVARHSDATARKLRESLPVNPGPPTDPEAAQAAYQKAREATIDAMRRIETSAQEEADEANAEHSRKIAKHQEAIASLRDRQQETLVGIERRKSDALAALQEKARPELEDLRADAAVAQERADAEKLHANTRSMVEHHESERKAAKADSKALTKAIRGLDALHSDLTDQLPIKGVTIEDGELFRWGLPFRRLNHADQVKTALAVAELRAGKVPVLIVDGLEALDPEAFAELKAQTEQREVQLIAARVGEGPLNVEAT